MEKVYVKTVEQLRKTFRQPCKIELRVSWFD